MAARRARRPRKLTSGMVRVILTFQIIPYIILSAVLIRFYSVRNHEQVERTVTTSVENAGTLVMDNITSAIELSRQASYDGVIKKSYETWLRNGDESAMYRTVSAYLGQTYKFSRSISNTILLYTEPMTMEYYTYSNMAGATYANIDEFKQNTDEAVRLVAQDLGTRTAMVGLDGHLYVVRNIVLSNYEPFTTLVMEVNMDRMFERMQNVMWEKDWLVLLEDVPIYSSEEKGEVQRLGETDRKQNTMQAEHAEFEHTEVERAEDGGAESEHSDDNRAGEISGTQTIAGEATEALLAAWNKLKDETGKTVEGGLQTVYSARDAAAVTQMKVNGQTFWFVHCLDRSAILNSRNEFLILYVVVFVTLIPLLIATFYYFYTNINRPIGALMKGSEKIRKGEYGCRVEPFDRNEEIGSLVETFNHMSVSLEDSFNRIYVEEIAEREATLKALQAQINPHFLNNTLEIINWKARMNGAEDVSEMISALSVMMNATLNRNNEMFIRMQEELSYVDAYLTIIRERFGSRIAFTTEVDEKLLDVSIPRLIIQPLVENAVEHGAKNRDGVMEGKLTVAGDAKELTITVQNSGELTEEDREKVRRLLADEKPSHDGADEHAADEKPDRPSIGIRNVHRRLRILYGPESGLEIEGDGNGGTISRIRIVRKRNNF